MEDDNCHDDDGDGDADDCGDDIEGDTTMMIIMVTGVSNDYNFFNDHENMIAIGRE